MIRAAAVAVLVLCTLCFGVSAAGSRVAAAPVVDGWNISAGTADCNCLDVNVVLTSDTPTVIHLEWGTSSALGSQTTSTPVPIGTRVSFTLHWTPRLDPGSYYVRLVADSNAGTTTTETDSLSIGADGSVHMAPPPFPPRPPGPTGPKVTASVSPTAPVTVVVGDTVDFTVRITTNAVWPSSSEVGVWFTLPGETGVCSGCVPDAADVVEVVSATTSLGTSCTNRVICNFGLVGGNADVTATVRLRARVSGDYRFIAQPDYAPAVTVPVTILPRVADLAVDPVPAVDRVGIGRRVLRSVTIENHGPNAVSDAVLIVGSPRLVSVRAFVGALPCSPIPIRCPLGELASGQSASVTIQFTGRHAGRTHVPVGVASQAAGDSLTNNNATSIGVNVAAVSRPAPR